MTKARTLFFWGLGLVVLGAIAYGVLGFTARTMAEMKIKELLAGMQDVASAEYGEVDVNLLDMSATVRDVRVKVIGGVEFTVNKLVLSRFEQLDGMPRALSMSVRGVRIPLAQEALSSRWQILRELGYDVLALDYDLDFDYDPKTRWFRLQELRLDVRNAGVLSMKMALANVNLAALLEGGPEMAFMAIERGELRYEDLSLVGRIFDSFAREEGVSPDEVRASLEQGIAEREANAAERGDDFSVAALSALRRFIKAPGSISLHAQPLGGVSVMQLMALQDPVEVLKALNMFFEIDEVVNQ